MQFTDLKNDVDIVFENHAKHASLLDKIDTAQALFDYWKTQEQNQTSHQKGFILKCNFPAKAFLEKIWIEDLFNALMFELDELLAQQDLEEQKREDITEFKTNLIEFKQVCADQIKQINEPFSSVKTLFPKLAINENTILFYNQRDFSSIIGALMDKFSEQVSNGLKFEIYLPPNQNEKLSDQENLRNYAEIVFEKATENGLNPEKITLFINGKKIDSASMFKDSFDKWKSQSEQVHEERVNKAIKKEEPYFKGPR